jgi:DNA (cytosine-5)-methyltransferase 1
MTVCSGIEAPSAAWHALGFEPVAFSEIEHFPRSVLRHHYPDVPLFGDFTAIRNKHLRRLKIGTVDLVCAGTPCQSFSVAGLRKGLEDPRGNLTLALLALLRRARPRWVVWENVPGVLSADKGGAFAAFLSGLTGWDVPPRKWRNSGTIPPAYRGSYGVAWRVLDAQYFGVPQRRRRVFLVGYLGDWRPPAAVLFERQSLSGDSPPSREKGKAVAALTANGVGTWGADDNQGQAGHLIASCLTSREGKGPDSDCTNTLIPVLMDQGGSVMGVIEDGTVGTLRRETHGHEPVIAFDWQSGGDCRGLEPRETAQPFGAESVRRLTPVECERLMGFPDNFTLVPHNGKLAADGPRYRALGNSMAVPVVSWIGERIQEVEIMAAAKHGINQEADKCTK